MSKSTPRFAWLVTLPPTLLPRMIHNVGTKFRSFFNEMYRNSFLNNHLRHKISGHFQGHPCGQISGHT